MIDSSVYRIADQYKRRKGSIPVGKHIINMINKKQTDAKLKQIFSNGRDSRISAHFSGATIPLMHCLKSGSGKLLMLVYIW